MNFELNPAQEEIVRQVQALCQRFPDEYWREKDASHEFPHEFHHAIAQAAIWESPSPNSTAAVVWASPKPRC